MMKLWVITVIEELCLFSKSTFFEIIILTVSYPVAVIVNVKNILNYAPC
jgi:hypothetical protein